MVKKESFVNDKLQNALKTQEKTQHERPVF